MAEATLVQVYDSQGTAYHKAFDVFLKHTDQKQKAKDWLDRLVKGLRERRVFIDAGAGNGQVTAWFTGAFERTIAVEPNESLRNELRKHCPKADVIAATILGAQPAAQADLVLCSHVFYYIDGVDWLGHLERIASWLTPQGVLVVVLQNHNTDCMRMVEHFHGRRFDLSGLARAFEASHGGRYRIELATVPAKITTSSFDPAYTIAEFMLNLLPLPRPPLRTKLEDYVREHFAAPKGSFRFSCDQDFLQVRPR
jgi:SAM-dependent methyltransferase